jgi:hypothetical protein
MNEGAEWRRWLHEKSLVPLMYSSMHAQFQFQFKSSSSQTQWSRNKSGRWMRWRKKEEYRMEIGMDWLLVARNWEWVRQRKRSEPPTFFAPYPVGCASPPSFISHMFALLPPFSPTNANYQIGSAKWPKECSDLGLEENIKILNERDFELVFLESWLILIKTLIKWITYGLCVNVNIVLSSPKKNNDTDRIWPSERPRP